MSELCDEFSRLAAVTGKACIRNALAQSETIRSLAASESITRHLPPAHLPVRCILFDKTPESNWPVAWHQDLTIAVQNKADIVGYSNWSMKDGVRHVQPTAELLDSMVTIRIHLDDTPKENGALKVIPGSHLHGRVESDQISDYLIGEKICPCEAGDAILMKPLILHASDRSQEPGHRRVIHIEYADRSLLNPALRWHESADSTSPKVLT